MAGISKIRRKQKRDRGVIQFPGVREQEKKEAKRDLMAIMQAGSERRGRLEKEFDATKQGIELRESMAGLREIDFLKAKINYLTGLRKYALAHKEYRESEPAISQAIYLAKTMLQVRRMK